MKTLAALLAVLVPLSLPVLAVGSAAADPPSVTAGISYCKAHIPNNIEKDVCTAKILAHISAPFETSCTGKNVQVCVENGVENTIDAIAKQKPKTTKDFNDAMNDALKKPQQQAQQQQQQQQQANQKVVSNQSGISSSGLPTVSADDNNLNNILQIVFGIIGAFALLSITLSGLKYITAAGDAQKTAEAKSGIVYALVGLMLAIVAEAIVTFVVNRAA